MSRCQPSASGRSATVKFASLTSPASLHLGLLGDLQCIVDLDPKVPDRAFEFGMAEEKLNSPEILGPPMDQRRLRAARRMRAVSGGVKSNRSHPSPDDPGVLPSREMRRLRYAARKQKLLRLQICRAIHAATASRVGSVISNCTGRWVFFCMTIARGATGLPCTRSWTRSPTKSHPRNCCRWRG